MIPSNDRNWELLRRLSHLVNWDRIKALDRDLSYYRDNYSKSLCNKARRYTAMIELYPEHDEDMLFLYYVVSNGNYPYEACIHDRDVFSEDKPPDENGKGGHKKGEKKKLHVHVVLCFPNARTNSAVAKEFNLNLRFVKMFDSRSEALAYLTHRYEGAFKFPYTIDDCFGTLNMEMGEAITDVQDKFERLDRVKKFIDESGCVSISEVWEHCKKYHLLDVVKSNRPLINDFIRDKKNQIYIERKYSEVENDLRDELESCHKTIRNLRAQICDLEKIRMYSDNPFLTDEENKKDWRLKNEKFKN